MKIRSIGTPGNMRHRIELESGDPAWWLITHFTTYHASGNYNECDDAQLATLTRYMQVEHPGWRPFEAVEDDPSDRGEKTPVRTEAETAKMLREAEQNQPCPECHGEGTWKDDMISCTLCGGTGYVSRVVWENARDIVRGG